MLAPSDITPPFIGPCFKVLFSIYLNKINNRFVLCIIVRQDDQMHFTVWRHSPDDNYWNLVVLVFWGEGKPECPEKLSWSNGARMRTNNKLNLHNDAETGNQTWATLVRGMKYHCMKYHCIISAPLSSTHDMGSVHKGIHNK